MQVVKKKMIKTYPKHVIIQSGVLEYIEQKFNGKDKIKYKGDSIKKDHIIYLIYLLNNILTRKKDKYDLNEGNSIYSLFLRKDFISRYKLCVTFLEENNLFVKTANHNFGQSSKYKFTDFYEGLEKSFVKYKISDNVFLKKFENNYKGLTSYHREMNKKVEKLRPHMVKSFNKNLSIDVDEAYSTIENFTYKKFVANSYVIDEYKNQIWKYSIKQETDNRLHSVITRTNKKLLKFVKYNGFRMSEIDIRTSQPLFLYSILKAIYIDPNAQSELKDYLNKNLNRELTIKLQGINVDFKEIELFGKLIVEGDLYNYLENKVPLKIDDNGKIYRNVFEKERKYYSTGRNLIKEVVMESLYSGFRNSHEEVVFFRGLFPSIFKIIKVITSNSDKNYLSKLLQNVEAYIFLDLIGKDISNKFPDIPLFSKHDCLITYEKNIDEVGVLVADSFSKYINIKGNLLKTEHWKDIL